MFVSAILLAGGEGKRIKSKVPKPLLKINSRPIIAYSLQVLNKHSLIKEIILVANAKNIQDLSRLVKRSRFERVKKIVLGGPLRQVSVYNGLKAVGKKSDLILIHDCARPFINKKMVDSALNSARKYGAAITGVPVKATIKELISSSVHQLIVKRTLNREKLWEIQTPQAFKKDLIVKAYKKFGRIAVTDDAALVEKLGVRVRLVPGSYGNIKITTPEDLLIAGALVRK